MKELKKKAYNASFMPDDEFMFKIRKLAVQFYSGVAWENLTDLERAVFERYRG